VLCSLNATNVNFTEDLKVNNSEVCKEREFYYTVWNLPSSLENPFKINVIVLH